MKNARNCVENSCTVLYVGCELGQGPGLSYFGSVQNKNLFDPRILNQCSRVLFKNLVLFIFHYYATYVYYLLTMHGLL
jgi:hypothetical protein